MKTKISILVIMVNMMSLGYGDDSNLNGGQGNAEPTIFAHRLKDIWTDRESLVLEGLAEEYIPDSGFSPALIWTGEGWGNVSGGISRSTKWNSLVTFGFEQDFNKLAKKSNLGTFGLTAFYYVSSGDFAGDNIGALSSPSNIFSSDMVRIFEIYYKNEIETEYGKISARIGQLASDEDFMCLDYSDIFLNSNFGAIPANAYNALADGSWAFSQYALATLGGVLGYEKNNFDFKIGIYNGSSGEDVSGNHGFSYDLEGIALWYQGGYSYELCGLGGKVMLGGNWHGGKFLNYNTDEIVRNLYSFYFGIQQDIIVDKDGKSILGVFCRVGWAPDEDISDITKYIDAGFNWFSPIPNRPNDVFGIGVSVMELGNGFRRTEDFSRYDTMMESTYRFQITKAITLQPTFQVYFDAKDSGGNTNTSFVFGARAEVKF